MRDVDAFFEHRSDPEAMRYWSYSALTRRDQAESKVADAVEAMGSGSYLELALDLKGGPNAIGTVVLHSISTQNCRGEIGYSLARKYQGQGLMREALVAFIDHLFGPTGLIRLEADIHPDNEASRKILLHLGFEREGYMPDRWIIDGEVLDSEVYGLLRRNWRT